MENHYTTGTEHGEANGATAIAPKVNASNFCVETQLINASDQFSDVYCPTWAGGEGTRETRPGNTRTIGCHANPHCKASAPAPPHLPRDPGSWILVRV